MSSDTAIEDVSDRWPSATEAVRMRRRDDGRGEDDADE